MGCKILYEFHDFCSNSIKISLIIQRALVTENCLKPIKKVALKKSQLTKFLH